MGRILVLILLALAIWWLARGLFRAQARRGEPEQREARTEDMVACARCGVNLPRSEAREERGKFYCVNNPHCGQA